MKQNFLIKTFVLLMALVGGVNVSWAGDFNGSNYDQKVTVPGTFDLSYGTYTGFNRDSFFSNAKKIENSKNGAKAVFTFTVSEASKFLLSLEGSNGNGYGDYNCNLEIRIWAAAGAEPSDATKTFTVEDNNNWNDFNAYYLFTDELAAGDYKLSIKWTDQANVQNIKMAAVGSSKYDVSSDEVSLMTNWKTKALVNISNSKYSGYDNMEYTGAYDNVSFIINSQYDCDLDVAFQSSTDNADCSIKMTLVGANGTVLRSETKDITNNGWDTWGDYTTSSSISVSAGYQVLCIKFLGGGSNVMNLKVTPSNIVSGFKPTVTTNVNPTGSGTVAYAPTMFDKGDEVTFTATPNTGYVFSSWTDGEDTDLGTTNPLTKAIDDDITINANFAYDLDYWTTQLSGECVPGGLTLSRGTYSGHGSMGVESGGNVGYVQNNSTATYNFCVTKAGTYNFSWDTYKYSGTTVDVVIYDHETKTEELSKELTIPDGTSYATDVQELGALTVGPKTMVLTFHCSSDFVLNYKNLALRRSTPDYYSFSYSVVGGPAKLVSMSTSLAAVDGKYEEGTIITLTAANNPIYSFQKWSDNSTAATKTIKLMADGSETATYTENEGYLAGWDYSGGTSLADYVESEENESSAITLYDATNDQMTNETGWIRDNSYSHIWKVGEYDYVARVNARNYKDMTVQSKLKYGYNVWPNMKLQYSTDGTTWTDIDDATLTLTSSWQSLNATLPAACNHATQLYIRWASIRKGDLVGSASDYRNVYITDVYVLGKYEVYPDDVAPALTYSTPSANATSAKSAGTITLNFDKNIKKTNSFSATLNGQSLTGTVLGSRLTLEYSGLAYNTQYTMTLAANSITNENDVALASNTTLTFTTVNRPTVAEKHAFDFVIGVDGTADEAFAAANAQNASRYYIFVPDGEYQLTGATGDDYHHNKTTVNKTVSVIGQSRTGSVLWNESEEAGISATSTLDLQGQYSYLQDITLKNWRGRGRADAGVAVALSERSYNIYKNVELWSNQDTYVSGSVAYWEGGRISGSVDYICGGGNIWFEGTELLNTRYGSVITAPNTNTDDVWGYVFSNCSIGSYWNNSNVPDGASVCTNGSYTLGRPWQNAPRATFLNTVMNVLPESKGWAGMGTNLAFHFNEFGSMSKTGLLQDLSVRNVNSLNQDNASCDTNPVLTQVEASAFNLDAVMGNSFKPTVYTEQCAAPVITYSDKTISWTDDDYALCYVIFKNGKYVANVTTNSFVPNDNGSYTVRSANERGGLGESSNVVVVDHFVELSEKKTYTPEAGEADVVLTRSIAADKWNTIVLPFDMDADQITSTFGKSTQVAELSSLSDDVLHFTSVTSMNANEPYLIMVASDFTTATINGVTIKEGTPSKTTVSGVDFVGSYDAVTEIPASDEDYTYYFISNNKLYSTASSGTSNKMRGMRAYFKVPGSTAARQLSFVVDEEGGEATGVSAALNDKGQMTNDKVVYDLQGRKVAQPTNGLYIVNGKKVLVP